MKKNNIVKESKDFEKAIKRGKFYKNNLYIIYVIDNDYNNEKKLFRQKLSRTRKQLS